VATDTPADDFTLMRGHGLPLPVGLDIRRLRTRVWRRAPLINSRFKVSRFLNQDDRKVRVGGCLGELEKRRRLTHEIIPAYHTGAPYCPAENITQKAGFGSVRMYKSEHVELRPALFHRRNNVE
jgi:hypothetical protein